MNAFLAIAQGSEEPPVFLEVKYRGDNTVSEDKHIALVGKGEPFYCTAVYLSTAYLFSVEPR